MISTESESVVRAYDSTFIHNFAIEAGVVAASTNGYFEFYNTTITENYAMSISVGEIFDVANLPKISRSQIYANEIISKSQILIEFNTRCRVLCHIPEDYKSYVNNNLNYLDVIQSNVCFQMIKSNFEILNGTTIYDQEGVISAFSSVLQISD